MRLLEEYIEKYGVVKQGHVLKVDSFLNHQMEPRIYREMGRELTRLFADWKITKVLTIEASGIALAMMAAQQLDVPCLFAKKSRTKNIDGEVYATRVASYTHGDTNDVIVAKRFLSSDDRVLIIDDFLARGQALLGLIDLCRQAGAEVIGCGIAIEKGFQEGGALVRGLGVRVESLAIIDSMSEDGVVFRR